RRRAGPVGVVWCGIRPGRTPWRRPYRWFNGAAIGNPDPDVDPFTGRRRRAGRPDPRQDDPMTDVAASLAELAHRHGVATEYVDWRDRPTPVPAATLVAVLAALGVPAATEEQRRASLAAHDRRYWSRSLPPTVHV